MKQPNASKKVKKSEAKAKDKEVREYYEAESWQFSSCGD